MLTDCCCCGYDDAHFLFGDPRKGAGKGMLLLLYYYYYYHDHYWVIQHASSVAICYWCGMRRGLSTCICIPLRCVHGWVVRKRMNRSRCRLAADCCRLLSIILHNYRKFYLKTLAVGKQPFKVIQGHWYWCQLCLYGFQDIEGYELTCCWFIRF